MEIAYRPLEPDDYDKVRQLLIDIGWQARVRDQKRFEKMMRGASRTVIASEGACRWLRESLI
jgi:hypothetical protein